MADFETYGDLHISIDDDHVATAEIRRAPNNFFDLDLIESMGSAFSDLDDEPACRAIVLCADGRHFSAGADFAGGGSAPETPRRNRDGSPRHLYDAAYDLFSTRTPVVAAVQGAAVGGGLGVACFSDFRVAAPQARFAANFARLGFHHGFGLERDAATDRREPESPRTALHGTTDHRRGSVRDRPCRPARPARFATRCSARVGGGDRRVSPAGRRIDPPDDAWRPRRRSPHCDRSREGRTGSAAPDRRLVGRGRGNGRAPISELHRHLIRSRPLTSLTSLNSAHDRPRGTGHLGRRPDPSGDRARSRR